MKGVKGGAVVFRQLQTDGDTLKFFWVVFWRLLRNEILRQIFLQNIRIGQAGVSLLPAVELKIWDAVHVD